MIDVTEAPQIHTDSVLDTANRSSVHIPLMTHNLEESGDFTWALWVKSDRLSRYYEAVLDMAITTPGCILEWQTKIGASTGPDEKVPASR